MSNYVAYHNANQNGKLVINPDEVFSFVSSRAKGHLDNTVGQKVWIVTGLREGDKKNDYHLLGFYIPTEVKSVGDEPNFVWGISGPNPQILEKRVFLNEKEWFPTLFKSQGSFALGISKIEQDINHALEELIANKKIVSQRNK